MVTAIVTGANRGIGREVARQLESRGLTVIGTTRDRLDVRDPKSVAAFVATVGSIDVLVNNAGIAMDGFDSEVARNTIETNLRGPMRLTDALLSKLTDGARVVNVSSGMGDLSILSKPLQKRVLEADRTALVALANEFVETVTSRTHEKQGWPSSAYGVSKALLNAFTRVLAKEQPRLRVNSVCPGWVRTDMGGRSAPRSVQEGAAGIVWAATELDATGGFYRDEKPVSW